MRGVLRFAPLADFRVTFLRPADHVDLAIAELLAASGMAHANPLANHFALHLGNGGEDPQHEAAAVRRRANSHVEKMNMNPLFNPRLDHLDAIAKAAEPSRNCGHDDMVAGLQSRQEFSAGGAVAE